MAELPSYSAGANVSIAATNLSSDTEYVFTCYASSVVGDGEHSDQITVRTGEFPTSYTTKKYVFAVMQSTSHVYCI